MEGQVATHAGADGAVVEQYNRSRRGEWTRAARAHQAKRQTSATALRCVFTSHPLGWWNDLAEREEAS